MDEDVVADLGLGHAGEAHLLHDAAEADPSAAEQGIVALDLEHLSGNGEAHRS